MALPISLEGKQGIIGGLRRKASDEEGMHRANASKFSDLFNARAARDAKGTQTPNRTDQKGPSLRWFFSKGPENHLWDSKTGAKQRN